MRRRSGGELRIVGKKVMGKDEEPEVRALFDRMEIATDIVLGSVVGFTFSESYREKIMNDSSQNPMQLDGDILVLSIVTVFCVAVIKSVAFFIRVRRSWLSLGFLIVSAFLLSIFVTQWGGDTDFSAFYPVQNVLFIWLLTAVFLTVVWRAYFSGENSVLKSGD